MRNLYLILLMLSGAILTQAQTTEVSNKRHILPKGAWGVEVGLNATSALLLAVKKDPDSSNLNPYLLQLRLSKGKWGVHAGGGGKHNHSFNSVAGFADSQTKDTDELQFRVGPDYRADLGKRFMAHVGLDYVLHYFKNKTVTDSGYDVIEAINQQSLHGVGCTAGVSYQITPRLALMTEANFQWLTGYRDSARKFKNFPELNDNLNNEKISTVRKSVLGGIFLMWRF